MATTNSTGEKGGLLDEIINSMDKTQGVVRSKKDTAKPNKGKDVSSTGTETKKNDKMDIGRGHVHVSQKASSDTGRSHGLHKPSSSKSSSTSSKIPTGTKIITSAAKVSDNNSQTAGPSSTAEFVAPNFSGSQLTPLGVETQLNAFMQAMTLQNQAVMGYMSKMDAFMSSFAPASDLADAQNYETGSEEDEADNNEQMDANKSEEATGAINTDDVDELLHDAKAAHQQDYEKEELGPAINASLAQMAEDMLKTNLTSEQCKTKTEAIKRPSNLPHLMPPRVNEEIWKMEEVSTACRKADIRHQHTQDLLTKSTVNIFTTVNDMLQTPNGLDKPAMKKVIEKLIATAQLVTSAVHEINYRRKDNFRKVLPAHMAPLCGYNKEVTSNLFGDDASKTMKDINDAKKAFSSNQFKGKAQRGKRFLGQGMRNGGYTRPQNHVMPQYQQLYQPQSRYQQQYQPQFQPQFQQPMAMEHFNYAPRGGTSRGRGGPGRGFKRGKNRGGQ